MSVSSNIEAQEDDSTSSFAAVGHAGTSQGAGDVEGLDETPSNGWGDYPLDSVFVRKDTRTVNDIMARIDKRRYKLDPEFQRDFVWPLQHQVRLIESCLMRIPLPVFYLAEDNDGKIIVVDGLQRLSTLHRFVNDEFVLKDLDASNPNSKIHNKKFSQLPVNLQERIEDTQLTLFILDPQAPEQARLDIFERVNSGVPLTRQQMRNCMYTGYATLWLKQAAESEVFLEATGGSLPAKPMRDREVINRFCAFYLLGHQAYNGDMDEFLAQGLKTMNQMSIDDLRKLMSAFIQSMKINYELFGHHAFRKSLTSNDSKRAMINISLFDVLATFFAKNKIVDEQKVVIAEKIKYLMLDEQFMNAISRSTNNRDNVSCRHQLIQNVLND